MSADTSMSMSSQATAVMAEEFNTQSTTVDQAPSTDAATKLAAAIDDFLGDLEKKFKNISNEVLNKLDDMAERCDRLEAELMARDATGLDAGGRVSVKEGGPPGPV